MCGIFAYIGQRNCPPLLHDGLKRLEYRGYDSAGIAAMKVKGGEITCIKASGKVSSLDLLQFAQDTYHIGISHTRWATHGAPTQINAHPHLNTDGTIALVHNGIIENYRALKEILLKKGITLKSETDSEVIVHLISEMYKGDIAEAVYAALQDIEGAYGIAVITSHEPDKIVGIRKGSPLIVGIGNGESFLASDAASIIPHTKNVLYLEDGEMVTLRGDEYTVTKKNSGALRKEIVTLTMDASAVEKKGFDYFMQKEIFEQPETIFNTMRGRILHDRATVKLDGLNLSENEMRNVRKICIVACGTSWHAGLVGEYLLENLSGVPVEVDYASEFTHRNLIPEVDTLYLCISQSGETADTLGALREISAKGAAVYGIVNTVGSTIARETKGGIFLHAGPEIGVASTKAFTSQVIALILLSLKFGRLRTISYIEGMRVISALEKIPEQALRILKSAGEVQKIAKTYFTEGNALYLGRAYNYPVALEGALKLKEISYIHAEGYPAAEMKHGPIALIDKKMPVVVIATKSDIYPKVISNIQEVKARSGRVIAIASEGDTELEKYCDAVIHVPETIDCLSPVLNVIPLQLLAYYAAVSRGLDVDQPRNLAKSVTVE